VPYVYEAFREVYQIDGNHKWREIMHSIAQHALQDYQDFETSANASTCSYTPEPNELGVINANAYRAFLLMRAAVDFSEEQYRKVAERNMTFVIESQNADGSWYYSTDGQRDFVDHFHTCFVLKALAKIELLTGNRECTKAIERGVGYYVGNLFDRRLPKPFSRQPRLTVYRRELYQSGCIAERSFFSSRRYLVDCPQPGRMAEARRLLPKPPASPRLGQLPYASLGPIPIV
jgi:hypothetical protein